MRNDDDEDEKIFHEGQRRAAASRKRTTTKRQAKKARRKKAEPFVMVPRWWIEAAAKAAKSPTTLVLIELLWLRWRTKGSTFPLPNGRLQRLGVSRKLKQRTLRQLERVQLVGVKRLARKTPVVTLNAL